MHIQREMTSPLAVEHAAAVYGIQAEVLYDQRSSDVSLIERIWRTHSDVDDTCIAVADGRWDMMFFMHDDQCNVMITGPQTTAITIPHVAGSEWLGIRFRLGVSLQNVTMRALVNEGIDLPNGAHESFWFNSQVWTRPNYDNAEVFVERLIRQDLLIRDPVVSSVLEGHPQAWSPRALQYRFQQSIGLPAKTVQQIERAQAATALLQGGTAIPDVVFQLGYYDQSHLSNSLKHYIGSTPHQLIPKSTP